MERQKLGIEAEFKAVQFIEKGRQLAEQLGVATIEMSDDFDQMRKVQSKLKGWVSEHFDSAYMDLLSERAIWMCCRNSEGKPVAVQAMRCDDLGSSTLETFLAGHLKRLNGGVIVSASPGPRAITGTAVYHGELYVKRKFRANQLAPILSRMAQAIALIRWRPDAIYGLANKNLLLSGYFDRSAFAHAAPHVETWEDLPPNYSADYSLVWNLFEDLTHMVRIGHEAYVEGAGKPQT